MPIGTPAYMAPEQAHEYDDGDESDALYEDGINPDHPTCENCGHAHIHPEQDWIPVGVGTCAPADTLPTLPRIKL